MVRVLIVTEAAEGLGHVLPWLELCKQLTARGVKVQLACPNPLAAQDAFCDLDMNLVQIFFPSMHCGPTDMNCSSWEEILFSLGYASQAAVIACMKQIRGLINNFRPTVLLVDYAPISAVLAALMHIPIIRVGIGYCTPPLQSQGPVWLPLQNENGKVEKIGADKTFRANRARFMIDACFGSVLGASSQPSKEIVFDDLIFHADERLIVCDPEFDHYRDMRQFDSARYVGFTRLPRALGTQPNEVSLVFNRAPKKMKILVYLKPNTAGFYEYIEQLKQLPQSVCVVLGIELPQVFMNRQSNITFVARSGDIHGALEACDIFITNGGLHTLSGALSLSKPTVIVPSQREQAATALLLKNHALIRVCVCAKEIAFAVKSAVMASQNGYKNFKVKRQLIFAEDQIISSIIKFG